MGSYLGKIVNKAKVLLEIKNNYETIKSIIKINKTSFIKIMELIKYTYMNKYNYIITLVEPDQVKEIVDQINNYKRNASNNIECLTSLIIGSMLLRCCIQLSRHVQCLIYV